MESSGWPNRAVAVVLGRDRMARTTSFARVTANAPVAESARYMRLCTCVDTALLLRRRLCSDSAPALWRRELSMPVAIHASTFVDAMHVARGVVAIPDVQ